MFTPLAPFTLKVAILPPLDMLTAPEVAVRFSVVTAPPDVIDRAGAAAVPASAAVTEPFAVNAPALFAAKVPVVTFPVATLPPAVVRVV